MSTVAIVLRRVAESFVWVHKLDVDCSNGTVEQGPQELRGLERPSSFSACVSR